MKTPEKNLSGYNQTTQELLGRSGQTNQFPVVLKSLGDITRQVTMNMGKANLHCMQVPEKDATIIIRSFVCNPVVYYLDEGNYAIEHVYGVRIYQKDEKSGLFYYFDGDGQHLWSHASHKVYIDLPNGEKGRACELLYYTDTYYKLF